MNMSKMITFAAITAIALSARAETIIATNTLDGVTCSPASDLKWQIILDTEAKTALLGLNRNGEPGGTWEANTALGLESAATTVTIPRSFTKDGVEYEVGDISMRAFYQFPTTLKNVTVLENVTEVGARAFHGIPLENLLFKGPLAGSQTIAFSTTNGWYPFSNARNVKFVVVGPNVRTGGSRDRFKFSNSTGVTVLMPDNESNRTWNNGATGVVAEKDTKNNNIVFYGPGYDFDMTIGEKTVTMIPTTANGLTNVLTYAKTFKSAFDLDTNISVTNTLDLADVAITEDMVSGVTFDRLMFSAKTQNQLNAILGAFPATTPISIDPTGLTENMVIPETYTNVYVKTVPGVTIKRTANGFMIIVR